MLGRTLGHYKILEKLGAGGMGEVYLAEDTTLHRKIALKLLPTELATSEERLERFQREATTLAALDHPNIVTIYTVEDAEGLYFLTMQLVEGKRLSDLIPKGGMPVERIFEIAIPLADALATAHEKGVIHRDLKPGNIMVTDDGRVKVLDFGLAKLRPEFEAQEATELPTEPLTEEGRVLGTVHYMSPEQLEGRDLDARTDIFSLGVILYEMATGERPFQGDTFASAISAIMRDTPHEVDALRTDLPHHLGRIVRHCLDKNPERRFQSAKDVRNELEDLQREESSQVAAPSAPAPRSRVSRETRWLPVAAALLISLVGVIAWLLLRPAPGDEQVVVAEPEPPMIVVLPFENLGPPEDEYFADGLTEELISRLAGVSGLRVISRTTAMQYKKDRPSLSQIGEELGVEYVLEGSVRWAHAPDSHGRVRITPQLIRVIDDTHLWAASYDKVIDDVFKIQSEIATETVSQLGVSLQASERRSIERQPTENLGAYEAYLRGKSYSESYLEGDYRLAIQMFRRAVELDAAFIEAWVSLSGSHSFMYHMGYDRSEERRAQARLAAEKAIEIDSESPQGHKALGSYFYLIDKDYDRAEQELILAQKSLPSDVELLAVRGFIQRRRGEWEESLAALDKALEIEPRAYEVYYNQGYTLVYMRRYKDAQLYIDEALRLRPDLARPYRLKAISIWLWKGDVQESRRVLEKMPQPGAQLLSWLWQELYERDYKAATERLMREPVEVVHQTTWLLPRQFLIGWLALLRDEPERAHRAFENAENLLEERLRESDDFRLHSALGLTYAALGKKQEAKRESEKAVSMYSITKDAFEGTDLVLQLAWMYTFAGEYEAAVRELDRLLTIPSQISVPLLRIDPRWDPLRDHPGFQALLEKHGPDTS